MRTRSMRINAIAKKLALRIRKRKDKDKQCKRLKLRRGFVTQPKPDGRIIAYDLETTSIAKGNPKPLYLTAYGAEFWFSGVVRDIDHLLLLLKERFLIKENIGCRYVAWNGNNFDCYFVAAALLHDPLYIIRPSLTATKSLRGLRISKRGNEEDEYWDFLDGISMLGAVGIKLEKFLKCFAPDKLKLDAPDWDKETFNPKNKKHVEYAERDSEGLFYGLMKAQEVVSEHFNLGLKPTIGNLGIRIFRNHIPFGVSCHPPSEKLRRIIRDYAFRGGFCYCVKKYEGPVWKYDLNQAYAAAMREQWLPAGRITRTKGEPKYGNCYISLVTLDNRFNRVPLYIRANHSMGGVLRPTACYQMDSRETVWLTSREIQQLRSEGNWRIKFHQSYVWEEEFTMEEYVGKLEELRINAPGGKNSAQGQMMKYIGNNSYGKTVEELDGLELIMANEQPDGYSEYFSEEEGLQHVWFRFGEPGTRDYHQPQIGAFITAHVRMVLREAILRNPGAWLYADTDCVVYSRPVQLDTDENLYGKWKVEVEGDRYRIIAKKVYASVDGAVKHAKGMNVRKLTDSDMEDWYHGIPPMKKQIQRQNFVKVMSGMDMFVERIKMGQQL